MTYKIMEDAPPKNATYFDIIFIYYMTIYMSIYMKIYMSIYMRLWDVKIKLIKQNKQKLESNLRLIFH